MTLFAVSKRGKMTGLTFKDTAAQGAVVVAAIAIRRSDLQPSELAALADYYTNDVEVEIAAIRRIDGGPRPMDLALERSEQNGHTGEERMRPGSAEECRACGKLIGDDPAARFYTPPAGPPVPVHGGCYREVERGFESTVAADEMVEAYAGTPDPSLTDEETAARAAFLAAVNAQDPPSDLRIALIDAYDSGDPPRVHAARVLAGLEQDDNVELPTGVIPRAVYLGWLRRGPLPEVEEVADDQVDQVADDEQGPASEEDS